MVKQKLVRQKLSRGLRRALAQVLESSWDAELASAKEMLRDLYGTSLPDRRTIAKALARHAFTDLVVLDNWLNGRRLRPVDHVLAQDTRGDQPCCSVHLTE